MDAQIDMNGMNNSILAADNEGTGTEFLWGFLMGLLLGVFMLLMVSSARLDVLKLQLTRLPSPFCASFLTAPSPASKRSACCLALA
jgi:hypothetical protein